MKAFHITRIENLYGESGIIARGLIPSVGDRCKSVGDNNCAVYFTNDYYTLPVWYSHLYRNVSPDKLCVLSFEIADECCTYRGEKEYYTCDPIQPERITMVRFLHGVTFEEVPFRYISSQDLYYGEWGFNPVPLTYILNEVPIKTLSIKKTSSSLK